MFRCLRLVAGAGLLSDKITAGWLVTAGWWLVTGAGLV